MSSGRHCIFSNTPCLKLYLTNILAWTYRVISKKLTDRKAELKDRRKMLLEKEKGYISGQKQRGQREQDKPNDSLLFLFQETLPTPCIFHLSRYFYIKKTKNKSFAELLIHQAGSTLHAPLSHCAPVFLKHQLSSAPPGQTHSYFSKDTRLLSVTLYDEERSDLFRNFQKVDNFILKVIHLQPQCEISYIRHSL